MKSATSRVLDANLNSLRGLFRFRPVQVFTNEVKGSPLLHGMTAVVKFDLGSISNIKLIVHPPDISELLGCPGIVRYRIMVPSLSHEWPWDHQEGHFRIVECASQVEILHLPLTVKHEAIPVMTRRDLARPVVKIG